MYEFKVLQPEEYERLRDFPDGFVPNPETSRAIVVATGNGDLVARIFLLAPTHVEGPYVAPEHRNGTLASRLIGAAESEAKKLGITRMFAYAVDGQIAGYLRRLGYKQQPWTVWAKEIE